MLYTCFIYVTNVSIHGRDNFDSNSKNIIKITKESTRAKKFITMKSPSMLGPDPNIVSTTERHSFLCSPENNFFCSERGNSTEPGKARDPMRNLQKYFLPIS